MRPRNPHPVICLVVLAAYLLNLAFVASGAVLCHDPHGQAQLEFACEHGHCGVVPEADHHHDSDETCWSSTCPCEDTSLGITVTATLNRDDQQGRLPSSFDCVLWCEEPGTPPDPWASFVIRRPPSGIASQLRQLRTIVLIV